MSKVLGIGARLVRWFNTGTGYLWRRMGHLLMHCDTEFGEILAGLLAVGWGCFILFTDDGGYSVFSQLPFVPLWAWGVVVTGLGLSHLFGALLPMEKLRRGAAYIGAPFWTVVAVLIISQGRAAFGYYAYGLFALTCGWVFLRRCVVSPPRKEKADSGQPHD